MLDILNFIKNLVYAPDDNRKRKASQDSSRTPVNAKFRKLHTSQMAGSPEADEWFSPYNKSRSSLNSSLNRNKTNSSKENVTLIIDDDDILEMSKPKQNNFSSTPNYSFNTKPVLQLSDDDEDVTFLKINKKSEQKRSKMKKAGYDYIKPYPYLSDNHKSQIQNGSKKDFTSPILSSIRDMKTRFNFSRPPVRSTTLDQSFRLDEKMKYKQLLAQAAPNYCALRNSFSKYSSPLGKIFNDTSGRRGRKLTEMSLNKDKPSAFIDLTVNGINELPRKPFSTKDAIKKVLDKFTPEPIIIKDSDSDVEILPQPPSPKPDIKIERVNSLKKIIDTSEETHAEWLDKIIEKHRNNVAKFDRDIRNQIAQTEKLGEVTSEIQAQRLEDQMVKCLKIKDIILPVRFDFSFPELSDEDEYIIDRALNGKRPSTELLVQKFNLKLTRADILTLEGLNWLNDEVINFYMNLLIERGKNSKWPSVYAMNTFFYPKLLKDGASSLRRWTRRIDLFSCDIVAVPIHQTMHWCMSIIDFKKCTIKYYDSMGRPNYECLEALLHYLKVEHLDKKKSEFDASGWSLENVQDIPQQMNGSDCGVFSCTYAEFLTRNAELSFSQENMPYLRRKMVLEILNGELLIQ
ncbi:hypothetical protein FQA39_LY07101 [Lamprigera yunnana]|nr:hypothetical protein FQA39_LY07101 [Lamprigera yunnana]